MRGETGYRNSLFESRKEKEVKIIYKEPTEYQVKNAPKYLDDAWVFNLRNKDESIRKENPFETHSEGQQGIQEPVEGRQNLEEENTLKQRKEVMAKMKEKMKEKKHEAKESKAYERKEDKKEKKKGK